jgi:sulfur transfer complex TusBCD TusB component (DsrH family)
MISRAHSETAFKLVEEINENGEEVSIIFTGRGTHYLNRPRIMEMLSFADLHTFSSEYNSTKDEVKAIDYVEFVRILEESERTFSWI